MNAKKKYVSPEAEHTEFEAEIIMQSNDNFITDDDWDLTLLGMEEYLR